MLWKINTKKSSNMPKKKTRVDENSGNWRRVQLKMVKIEAKIFKTD